MNTATDFGALRRWPARQVEPPPDADATPAATLLKGKCFLPAAAVRVAALLVADLGAMRRREWLSAFRVLDDRSWIEAGRTTDHHHHCGFGQRETVAGESLNENGQNAKGRTKQFGSLLRHAYGDVHTDLCPFSPA